MYILGRIACNAHTRRLDLVNLRVIGYHIGFSLYANLIRISPRQRGHSAGP